jgi:hypothetical protein
MSEIVPVISATGLYTPPESISNAELVESFNTYVERFNAAHAAEIAAGTVTALAPSSVEFIEKASGIKARHVMSKASMLDPDIMEPRWPERPNDQISVLAEIGVPRRRMRWRGPAAMPMSMPCCAPHRTCSGPIRRWRSKSSTNWGWTRLRL